MGIDIAYFAAADNEAAFEAERRVGGPAGPTYLATARGVCSAQRRSSRSLARPSTGSPPADSIVNMGTLEALLTRADVDAIMANPRSGGSPRDDQGAPENHGVITLTDSLRDALSNADDNRRADVVGPWRRTEQQLGWEDVTHDEHLMFSANCGTSPDVPRVPATSSLAASPYK